MTGFVPFQAHTVLPAAELNDALAAVDADALAAAAGVAAAEADAAKAETDAAAALASVSTAVSTATAALAAAQAAAAAGGSVKTVNGIGPDGSGNVVIVTGGSGSLTRPAFSLFTDVINYGGAPTWTDDGTAFVCSGPTFNSASAASRMKPDIPCFPTSAKMRSING